MSEHKIINSDSDLESESNDFICDSDPEIEVISESYFNIDAVDTLNKKNIKLRAKILKGKHINETLKENLSISIKTMESLDQMITELTNRVNLLEKTNGEITGELLQAQEENKVLTQENKILKQTNKKIDDQLIKITYEKNKLESHINSFSNKLVQDNNFLSRAVCFFFIASCSSFIYNYNQIKN